MALSGKLAADFASFYDACEQADVHLASVESNAAKVEAQLTRTSNSLSGVTIVQQAAIAAEAVDRIGGVSQLTNAELAKVGATAQEAADKLRAMGQEVPPKIQALADAARALKPPLDDARLGATELKDAILLAFDHPIYAVRDLAKAIGVDLTSMFGAAEVTAAVSGAAIVGALALVGKEAYDLTMQAAEMGEGIYDASLKMSASVPAVSTLKFAAEAANGSLEQLASLAFVMQQRMANNPTQFNDGLKALNVSAKDFSNLSVDQKVLAISTAMRQASDDTNIQATAMDLFGRQGRDGLSLLLKPLGELVDQGKELGFTWGTDTAEAAEKLAEKSRILDLQWTKLKTDVGIELIPAFTFLINNLNSVGNAFVKGSDGGLLFDLVMLGAKGNVDAVWAALDMFLGRTEKIPKTTGDAAKGVADWKGEIKDTQAYVENLDDALANQAEMEKNLDPATRKLIEAYTEMNAAGSGWKGTLDTLDGSVAEGIKFYLEAGVSQSLLAKAYGLTEVQVKAVASALKDEVESTKLAATASLQLAQLEAAADEALVKQKKDHLALDEQTQRQHDADILVLDQERVKLGLMTESAYQADKAQIEFNAYQRHLENLKKEEEADLLSNGLRLDAELAKADERYAKGLVTKDEYEAQYAAIEAKYAAIRMGIQDAYQAHENEALSRMQLVNQQAQDQIVADWTSSKLAASQYALGITEAQAAIEGDLNSQIAIVHTLGGEWIKAADAKKLFDGGGSFTYDLTTRAGVEQYRAMNTGEEISWSDEQIIAFAQKGGTLQQLMQMGVIHMKSFDVGGPTGDGGPALLHPDEYVVPRGGALVSGGGRGDTYITVQTLIGTVDELAAAIGQAQLQQSGRLFVRTA